MPSNQGYSTLNTLQNVAESLPSNSTNMRKEKIEINKLIYMRNGWLQPKFELWRRALSEHNYIGDVSEHMQATKQFSKPLHHSIKLGELAKKSLWHKKVGGFIHSQFSYIIKCDRACKSQLCEHKLHQVIFLLISFVQNVVSHLHKLHAEESPLNSAVLMKILLWQYKQSLSYDRAKTKNQQFFTLRWLIFAGLVTNFIISKSHIQAGLCKLQYACWK